jgi:hypothetical protein
MDPSTARACALAFPPSAAVETNPLNFPRQAWRASWVSYPWLRADG